MRRHFPLVAVLVVLAGCSGVFGGDGESTPTLTPAAVPTDEPTPEPAPQLAPGLTGNGIANASALVAAHESVLRNRSFTGQSETVVVTSNGSVLARSTRTLRVGPPETGAVSVSERNGSYGYPDNNSHPVRTESWTNGERVFLQRTYPDGTTTDDREQVGDGGRYGVGETGFVHPLGPFGTENASVTERDRAGAMAYLVRADARTGTGRDLSLRLLVDSRGVIHSYRLVRRTPATGNVSRVISEIRISRIGSTDVPERPSWVDEAMNRTNPPTGRE